MHYVFLILALTNPLIVISIFHLFSEQSNVNNKTKTTLFSHVIVMHGNVDALEGREILFI